ncbi:MAG: hypothetical protein KC656_06035 [Myxococcales bacterium]|nr:hypothetical protein [Myxococcales bacterium]
MRSWLLGVPTLRVRFALEDVTMIGNGERGVVFVMRDGAKRVYPGGATVDGRPSALWIDLSLLHGSDEGDDLV